MTVPKSQKDWINRCIVRVTKNRGETFART